VFGIIEGICLELDPTFEYEKVFIKYMEKNRNWCDEFGK
jgi:hypothetical protein